jgi:hypothetical protein
MSPKNTLVGSIYYPVVDAGFWSEGERGQLSDCNSLLGSNSLTNQLLNKKIII